MHLEKIEIKNFRMLKDVVFNISDTSNQGLTLFVGKNNTGKTSILKILEKMIPGSGGNSFEWYDFSVDFQIESLKLIQEYKFNDLTPQSLGIELILYISYSEEDSYQILRPFLMDLDEENNIIIIQSLYVIKDNEIQNIQNELLKMGVTGTSIEDYKKFNSFMRRNLSKYFKLTHKALSKDGSYAAEIKKEDLRRLIRVKSIKANRDISNKSSDHTLSNISDRLYNLMEAQVPEEYKRFQETISLTDESLTTAYAEVFKDALAQVEIFGGSNDANIEILSTIQEQDLLKNNTTLFYNKNNTYIPESYNGLGYLNLIGMILEIETIAKEYEQYNLEARGLNILFIEEPEAHTHPQLQYVFIKNIKNLLNEHKEKNIQTLMTTHSSHIVSECEFDDVIYLSNENGQTTARAFLDLKEIYKDDDGTYKLFEFIKKHLKLTRAELFFADKAILIEGDTERMLMRYMMESIDQRYMDPLILPLISQNISIVEVGAYGHVFKHLINFLKIKTLIVTDIDYGKHSDKGRVTKCDYDEAKLTSNATIKDFFNVDGTDLELIINYSEEDKIKEFCKIAYQTKEDGIQKKYVGRSFEEAFLNINFEYIDRIKEDFISMKNIKKFTKDKTPYVLVKECIDKKTSFATDLLFYGDGKWKIPKYIEEGLLWLRKDKLSQK